MSFMDKHSAISKLTLLLKERGLRTTPARIQVLGALLHEKEPVSVAHLKRRIRGADVVTLYRTLDSLVSAGIVREVDLRHSRAHYELAALRPHHHHIVCTSCGIVEDVPCTVSSSVRKVALRSSKFSSITDHSTEYFGLCRSCDRR